MEFHHCFCGILGRRKKDKGENKSPEMAGNTKGLIRLLQVKMEGQEKSISLELLSTSFTFPMPFIAPGPSRFKATVVNSEAASCEKNDRNDDDLSMKQENSDLDLQSHTCYSNKDHDQPVGKDIELFQSLDRDLNGMEMVRSGHLTDPGICRTEFWPSGRLARSCSDLGLRDMVTKISEEIPLSKSQSFLEFQVYEEAFNGIVESPLWSADKVLLKKHSYKFESSNSITEGINLGKNEISVYSPQQETVTFPMHSPTMTRVDEWLKGFLVQHPFQDVKEDDVDIDNDLPHSPDTCRSPARISSPSNGNPTFDITEEILHANSVVRSLNSSSTVAHMVAVGLKVVPQLSRFTTLRFVNLSSNSIVHIAPGSLPKSLHTLNLSRNNINVIAGLRELTRLRVLDLSHNRISRISQGLSNSRLIKELYLAGNKINEVDGLHRLLKLAVLDLSFNKIATTKALGQLVANYNSLMALNLLGNPIHTNINDDQLRKNLCSLLPELTYLNKQPINPQKVREAGNGAIAKLALGHSHRTIHRRRSVRKVTRSATIGQKN